MNVSNLYSDLRQIVCQVLCHTLGECGDEYAFLCGRACTNLGNQVVNLVLDCPDFHFGIDKSGGPDDLFNHHAFRLLKFIVSRCGADINNLLHHLFPFIKCQRTVIQCRRKTEPMLDQRELARPVTEVHSPDLRHSHMRFVDDKEKVFRKIIEQARWSGSRRSTRNMARVVFDAGAISDFPHHLQIKACALFEALCFHQLVQSAKFGQALFQFLFNSLHRSFKCFLRRNKLLGGIDYFILCFPKHFPINTIDVGYLLDLIAEELNPNRLFIFGTGNHFNNVAAHAHSTADKLEVVADVKDVQKLAEKVIPLKLVPFPYQNKLTRPFLRRADTVDATHRCNNDDVFLFAHQRTCCTQPQSINFVVDRGIFGDVRVGGGNVCFRLVIIVIADKELNPILREETLELAVKLGSKGFIVGHDQYRPVNLGYNIGDRERLAATGHSKQNLVTVATLHPFKQLTNRFRLVAGGFIFRCEFECAHREISLTTEERRNSGHRVL